MLSISKDITRPKPGTKSLPLGTSIFVSVFVSFVSVGLATVGDDDVLTLPDDCVFGASAFGASTFGISAIPAGNSIFITGGGSGAGVSGCTAIGLDGFTGLNTFVGFVIDFTQLFCVSTHAPKIG